MDDRDKKGRFAKGNTAGHGRPVLSGEQFSIESLRLAFIKEGEKQGMTFYEWCAKQAFNKDAHPLMLGMLRKLLPDLKQIEVAVDVEKVGFASFGPDEEAAKMDGLTVGNPTPAEADNNITPG